MSRKLVIFGPWCGEFSYEMSWWIPEIRQKRYDNFGDYDAIHIGFKGRGILYEDFIDQYIPYPEELENTLKYPATFGEHINGKIRDATPDNVIDYVNLFIKENNQIFNGNYDTVEIYQSNTELITHHRTMANTPYGIYKSYDLDDEYLEEISHQLDQHFINDNRDRVCIVARTRYRDEKTTNINNQDWDPDKWGEFVERLINELNLNIVVIEIERKYSRGGSLGFDRLSEKYPNRVAKINVDNKDDSVKEQIAILKNTKCSIYGSTGAVVLPFFINTPVFTQQCVNNGSRLRFDWQKKLTNNHEKVCIFDKYDKNTIYDSPVEEMFNKFKEYYEKIKQGW